MNAATISRPRVLLFDIDGTLLRVGRAESGIFLRTLADAFGRRPEPAGLSFAGKTNGQITLEVMAAAGLDEAEVHRQLPSLPARYDADLEAGLDAASVHVLPGVTSLLPALAERPSDFALGLLTGNWRGAARIKLDRAGLGDFFAFGAFGDDGIDRRTLVPPALARASDHVGRRVQPEEALIIGDSVRDVDCAHAHGLPCLAVATGHTPADDLRAAGAELVVDDLIHAARVLPWLGAVWDPEAAADPARV
ncbi:MAG: HAD family hydrolase [Acidobacteriota bacterium]